MVEKPRAWIPPEPTEDECIRHALYLFRGPTTHHGTYTLLRTIDGAEPNQTEPNGKVKSRGQTKLGGATAELLRGHRGDGPPLGISPVQDNSTCGWGAIDRDEYDLDHAAIAAELDEMQLPLLVVQSKSGGAHLLLFAFEDVPATLMQEALNIMREMLGLPEGIEIFPKQVVHSGPKSTNWLNMPYRGDTNTRCVLADGRELSWPEFLSHADRRSQATWMLEKFVANAKAAAEEEEENRRKGKDKRDDGPGEAPSADANDGEARLKFCREELRAHKEPANVLLTRFAFDLARYCRDAGLDPDRAKSEMYEEWQKLKVGEPEGDGVFEDIWQRQYAEGLAKGRPARKWSATVLPEYERVWISEDGSETTYRLQINGKIIPRITTAQWLDHRKFNEIALACIKDTFPALAAKYRDKWRESVTRAVQRAEPDWLNEGASRGELFIMMLQDFIYASPYRKLGLTREELYSGRAWESEKENRFYFRLNDLIDGIHRPGAGFKYTLFRKATPAELSDLIRKVGGGDKVLRINKKSTLRTFWVPTSIREFNKDPEMELEVPPVERSPI